MKIDFRKEIDRWYGHDSEYLACDATHIAVNIKHMHLDRPVIFPDKDSELNPCNRYTEGLVEYHP